ncbi:MULTISPECIES: HAD family hydrolase [unclassified Arthrobacter]|uniref:HAD family hydrolase n=1 Tax=unclassified Arthrobacter TaxID=235627 RepID=UPI001D1545E5|nr:MULTISPECIES: HAD family hydrolase [unclassified Arthrobacter]MCC3276618.1 HAD family hydrolase [Arthrobacter sp. zg-Y20]MCC3279842.1 HAD family hydrolase [Arthrobacter sp. zg-Y40]MCC9178400.1 HAD family hydrolase [Arthrobacter sp. zg-Y750]MDK1316778.1 HAD family hydrolase [Arthrobacter sp. zg.Y20]MDK1328210.1 HAD family hydrolase [Arthrobacter sp. zg-Y1143]
MGSSANGKRGVLFDVDGTLVDSNYLHAVCWWQAFRRMEHDVPMSAIHRAIGMGGDKLVEHLLGEDRNKDEDEKMDATHGAIFSTWWPALRSFDGASDLLKACADKDLTVVLASSASEAELKFLRTVIDADSAISGATSSGDAEASKPSPDILEAALESGGLEAANTVFVGDSVWDVKAAGKLSIPTIGLTCGGTSEAELLEAGAEEIYENPRALLADLENSLLRTLLQD